MLEENINLLIEALKDQQNIFGDILYEQISQDIIYPEETGFEIKKKIEVKEKSEDSLFAASVAGSEKFQSAENLDELNKLICECQKCPLGKTRNKFVFGVGDPKAGVMLIGEAPGADEDARGEPFVGRAGKLLNDILKAINFEREEVYIANIIKCRPPGNRNPLPEEMEKCIPYLYKQIELIKPKIILCLGLVAASELLKTKLSLGRLRGSVFEYGNIKVMVTYHPAALLRNPQWKKGCWEDVQKFRKLYDELNN
jgi:uracil-DNA glycosylase family 4